MLHLVCQSQNPEEIVLEAHGWIAGQDVALLEREERERRIEGQRLVLDLSGVKFVDEAGVDLLLRWVGPKLILRGGSLFVRGLLATHGLEMAPACETE